MKETEALGRLRPDHYLVTTLVSSQMARALAEREGIRIEDDLLVGFKWIGQRIDEAGPAGFLFGFEESHGYLKGTHVRDKDAAVASLLFAELAATVKDRKQTVLEYLDDLYIDVGHYGERLINKMFKGREGLDKIKALMAAFRTDPPRTIGGLAVTEVYDYKDHEIRDLAGRRRPPPARALRRPADLPHRAAGHAVRRPALGDRAEDQVLPLRPDRREWPRASSPRPRPRPQAA